MGILGVEARQAAKNLIMQGGPPRAKNYLAPNINSVEVEKKSVL